MKRTMLPHVAVCCIAFAGWLAGCTGGEQPKAPAGGGAGTEGAAAPAAAAVDPAKAATIKGKVMLKGAPPEAQPLQMEGDPKCHEAHGGKAPVSESYVVKDGALANVIVYLKDAPKASYPMPAGPVTLDQKGCMYLPHVTVLRTGQPLSISNSDPTTHNVHSLPKKDAKAEFNEGQPAGAPAITKKFTTPEIVRFKCDIHAWMSAYIGVFDHPFAAVTKADGTFEITGVPPGSYTVEVWHEKLKTKEMKVTVGEKETKQVDFEYAM